MRYILITGGAGNVGGSLARRLVMNPDNYVVILDNLLTGSTANLPERTYRNWHYINADVNRFADISSIMLSNRFDYVFHYAAVVGVQRTLSNPKQVLDDIEGIKNVLDMAKNTGVKRVFYSSSSEVYGEPVETPQKEDTTPLNSRLPYAIVKNVGEAFFRSYFQEFGLSYTIFRFFNTYGPLQSEDFVIAKFLKQALTDGDITVYGDGSQSRTFCYVEDNLDTIENILDKKLSINEVLNIGSDQEVSIRQLADTIIQLTDSRSVIRHLPPLPEGDMTRRKPDVEKMKKILGRPLSSLSYGIEEMINHTQLSVQ